MNNLCAALYCSTSCRHAGLAPLKRLKRLSGLRFAGPMPQLYCAGLQAGVVCLCVRLQVVSLFARSLFIEVGTGGCGFESHSSWLCWMSE